jgi:septum formation protein
MFNTRKLLILASSSPRRQQFLSDLGLAFTALPADIDETPLPDESPASFARRMAEDKAAVVAEQHQESWVIGADTVVTIDGMILGKPTDAAHALEILRSLQGKTHQVVTGLALFRRQDNLRESLIRTTEVSFTDFPDSILTAYIRTGDPMDKAGAYGIQSNGAFLVRAIQGSCTNVIGLPVNACVSLLLRYKIIAPLQKEK